MYMVALACSARTRRAVPCALSAGSGPATPGSPGLQAALAVLADVHEAVEDAAGGLPEAQRYTLCRSMLTAVGAAALARCLRADAGPALPALPCLNALVSRHGLWRCAGRQAWLMGMQRGSGLHDGQGCWALVGRGTCGQMRQPAPSCLLPACRLVPVI